jgi:hypothetical protein
MKNREGDFFTVPHRLLRDYTFDPEKKEEQNYLSRGAAYLFVVLCHLENVFCMEGKEWFYRTDRELASDAGLSFNTLRKYKGELKQHPELITIRQQAMRTKKGMSEESPTHYHLLI